MLDRTCVIVKKIDIIWWVKFLNRCGSFSKHLKYTAFVNFLKYEN